MRKQDKNTFQIKKGLRIVMLIVGLVLVGVGIAILLMDQGIGSIAILAAGVLLGLSAMIGPRTVKAHHDPLVENISYKMGENMKHRPEDVPLNPWDQIAGNEEQTEQ